MKEEWKTIIGYENYQVSNLGRVRSLRNNNVYYLNPMRRGYEGQKYECVRLSNAEGPKNFAVHRLVASYFVPNPNNYPIVNHIDEDKLNNKASNLEWCTYSYNMTYNGLSKRKGEKLRNRKDCSKPIEMYTLSGELIKIFPSVGEAARFLHKEGSQSTISRCCNGTRKDGSPRTAFGYMWRWKQSESDFDSLCDGAK